MDRLREFSIVTMSLPDLGRVSEFKAYVLGVHRHVATLEPVERVESMWLPPLVENVHMVFKHDGRPVGLKGDLRCGERPEMIEFRVSDGVCVPRRRSSRLGICTPVTVTLEGGGDLECQTQDIGADGLTLERAPGLRPQQLVSVSVMLPWESEEVRAEARVTRLGDDGVASLEFDRADRATRRRLIDFVTEQLRRRLAIVRALQEEQDDDWD
jgi:PilZ domain-containing protein